jgi:hypothetical protein
MNEKALFSQEFIEKLKSFDLEDEVFDEDRLLQINEHLLDKGDILE